MLNFSGFEGLIYRKRFLVISDLHIGIERELYQKGINIISQTKKLLEKIHKIKENFNVKYLILDGDIKHNIPITTLNEINELIEFFISLSDIFDRIYVIKGNHDGDIEKYIPKIEKIIVLKELYDKKYRVSFLHGNRKNKFDADIFVIGHHHFVKNITSTLGESFYEKVFVRGFTNDNKEVIILPAFSDLAGYWELGKFHGPIANKIIEYEVYTLDGILLDVFKNEAKNT